MNYAYLFDLEDERREHLSRHFIKMGASTRLHLDIPAINTEDFSTLIDGIEKGALVLIHRSIRQNNHELLAKKLLARKNNLVIYYSGSYQGDNECHGNLLIWGQAIGLKGKVNWHVDVFYEKLNEGCEAHICFEALISGSNAQEAEQWNLLLNELMDFENFSKSLLGHDRFDKISVNQIIKEHWENLVFRVNSNMTGPASAPYFNALKEFRNQTKHLFE